MVHLHLLYHLYIIYNNLPILSFYKYGVSLPPFGYYLFVFGRYIFINKSIISYCEHGDIGVYLRIIY